MKQLAIGLVCLLLSVSVQAAQVEVTQAWVKPTIPGTVNGATTWLCAIMAIKQ